MAGGRRPLPSAVAVGPGRQPWPSTLAVSSLDWQLLVHVGPRAALGEVGGGVAVPGQHPLGGEEALHADGAAGVDAARADAHLGSEAEAEAVSEPGAGVVEDAGAVHVALELLGGGLVLSDDHFRVATAEGVDVAHGLLDALDHLDGALEVRVLGAHVLGDGRAEGEPLVQVGPGEDLDALALEHVADVLEEGPVEQVLVQQ